MFLLSVPGAVYRQRAFPEDRNFQKQTTNPWSWSHFWLGLLGAYILQSSRGLSLFRSENKSIFAPDFKKREPGPICNQIKDVDGAKAEKVSEVEKSQVCGDTCWLAPLSMSQELTRWAKLQLRVGFTTQHVCVRI